MRTLFAMYLNVQTLMKHAKPVAIIVTVTEYVLSQEVLGSDK